MSLPSLLLSVFNALPDATLLLSAELRIEAVSDSYLAATLSRRETLLGQHMFEAFPDNPATPEAQAVHNLSASLQQVLATGKPHEMARQRYDVPDPDRPGQFVVRHWLPRNAPVLDEQGRVSHILHIVSDITLVVTGHARQRATNAELETTQQQLRQLNRELEARVQQRTREAETARAEAEEQRGRLERLFQQAPALINIFTGPEHVLTMVHPGTTEKLGNRPLLGLPRRQALPELPEAQHEPLDHVYRTGQPLSQAERLTRLDLHNNGELHDVYLDLSYQPLFDATGQIEGVMSFAIDVTERVQERRRADALQAEVLAAAQRQAEARAVVFQVFEETPASIALLRGPEHRFEYVNRAYQELFPGRELLGRPLAEALPDAAEQGFLALLDGVFRTGENFFGTELPLAIAQPAGRPPRQAYFTFTYQAYYEQGQVVGVSIFAYDVTGQVLARQQREAERQLLHDLFMQAPAAICILAGPELVYELVNPGYQQLFPGRQLGGRPILEALPEIAGHTVYHGFRQVYEQGVTLEAQALLIPLARPDDGVLEDRYFNYIQQPRRDEQGHPDGVLVFAFEVTEQVQARQQAQAMAAELSTANQQLVRTNVDLDNFIYTASHDLKAPISNIEGLLYLLQEQLPADNAPGQQVAPTLTRMLGSVERFKRTIDHLTEVSKLQKEHAAPSAAVDLAAVVEDVRQDLLPMVQALGAKLVVDVAAWPPIRFSEKNLRSVVYNLVSNALKYHSPDRPPRVDVRAHVQAGNTVLEVHDNGLGLSKDYLPKLFGMFQRFHDHVEGSGIGLYMVKRMVDNAGGRIEVHSQPGAGTTFFVHLPQANELSA